MDAIDQLELETACATLLLAAKYDAVRSITLEYTPGQSPVLKFVPSMGLDYVVVDIIVPHENS